jgi:hypothetical protein
MALVITGLVGLGCAVMLADPIGACVCGLIALAGRYLCFKKASSGLSGAKSPPELPRVSHLVGGLAIVSVVVGRSADRSSGAPLVPVVSAARPLNPINSYVKAPARRRDRLTGLLEPMSTRAAS